ncbi:GNAT family N-acetyltransferase [Nesterenkonia sp. CF4.4]|uniref:GNAT family N-acetyltransferase n=1 Tax=Nesterenkonia sp. CF4.4 TaxID=3373079 RepID=UPI003EE499CE
MEPTSESLSEAARGRIVLAWVKALGATPLGTCRDEWTFVERADLEAVVVVCVDGFGIAAAPPRVLELIRQSSPESLLDATALARMLPAGAEPIGSADLFFAEHGPRSSQVVVSAATPSDVTAMRGGASAAEWDESGIEETEHLWSALDPAGGLAAIAGYTRWRSALAQMSVLAGPQHRSAGFAYAAAAIGTQEALGEKLIPQWRSRQGNEASGRLAKRLGFTQLGVQAAVALNGQ